MKYIGAGLAGSPYSGVRCAPHGRMAAERRVRFIAARIGLSFADRVPAAVFLKYCARSLSLFLPRSSRSLWIHGEDVRQFDAALDLIHALRQAIPQMRIFLTSSMPITLEGIARRYIDDPVLPSPWPFSTAVRRFSRLLKPLAVVLLESAEGFPRAALRHAEQSGVPVIVANLSREGVESVIARDNGRGGLPFALLCATDNATAERLRARGVPDDRIIVTGGTYCDGTPRDAGETGVFLRRELGIAEDAPVVIAEDIVPGEEEMIAEAAARLRAAHPDVVMLISPRRRGRAGHIARILRRRGLPCRLRSAKAGREKPNALLLDLPGELPQLYRIALCVVAGGSFLGDGSMLNPCIPGRAGRPVFFGPLIGRHAETVAFFIENHTAMQTTPSHLAEDIEKLIGEASSSARPVAEDVRRLAERQGGTERLLAACRALLPDLPAEPRAQQGWRVKTPVVRVAESRLGEKILSLRSRRRIDDWDGLGRRLGRPETILCLGNGPSSEDPRLGDIAFDSLFRVNWKWKERRLFDRPDLVFVGDFATVKKVSSCIFAFRTLAQERAMLLRHLLMLRLRPLEYFTLERALPELGEKERYARPSNGACMVMTASALRPKRLVIAGIDLFLHPGGRYPGNFSASNEYAQVHDRAFEIRFIRDALAEYEGELLILSDALSECLSECGAPREKVRR